MASSVQAYQIVITNGITNAAPGDGFVSSQTVTQYGLNLETTPPGFTYALSQAKRRGNLRYRAIILQLSMVSNCYVPPASIVSNGTALVEGSSFAFQIYVEHGAASLVTIDELVAGVQLLGPACIKRCIARGLTVDLPAITEVFDPTSSTSTGVWGATTSLPRFGSRITSFDVGPYATSLPLAEAQVSVIAI